MADPITADEPLKPVCEALNGAVSRNEKRKAIKKLKRKQIRKEAAIREREEEEARSNDPEEQMRIRLREQEEAEIAERERREFEERERLWLEAAAKREEEEDRRQRELLEESERQEGEHANELEEDDECDDGEDGPAKVIWRGNEIIVKKKKVKVAKRSADRKRDDEDVDRPTSNPLPPQSVAFASHNGEQHIAAHELLEGVAQQVPNFGTEQDKAHCPFHLKTGACRFGDHCNRDHFSYPVSCTLLIKNMYNGPGLAWEQDEGLEHTDEEIERCYEEFYDDVHTEFLKSGELVNFKVCKNGSCHLRGNVYVHYKSLESAILAYNKMNTRFFAGKQLTCEFVGVTRWKVAICGEYMKSRLRTCSRGSACNFIHCFRNPGGDYEWADWDNPPPKYWRRKMAVLFGHSDESSYGKQIKPEDYESPMDSRRKGNPRESRYHSRRSPHDVKEMRDSDSVREDLYRKRDCHGSHSVRRTQHSEHSHRRKETSFLNVSEQFEENHKSKIDNYDVRHHPSDHDYSEDRFNEKDQKSLEKHQNSEEKNQAHKKHKRSHRTKAESSSNQEGQAFSDRQDKPEREHRLKKHKRHDEEHRFSDQLSDYTNDGRKRNSSCSSEEYYLSNTIDGQDRYNGGYCSNDSDSVREFSSPSRPRETMRVGERRMEQYKSRYHTSHTSHAKGRDGENGKLSKWGDADYKSSTFQSLDRWDDTKRDSRRERSDGDSCSGSSRSHRMPSKSYEKHKHHQGKRHHEVNGSGSDEMFDRKTRKNYSQSHTPPMNSASSEEKGLEPRIYAS